MKVLAVVVLTGFAGIALMWRPAGEDAAAVGARGFQQVSLSTCSDWQRARMGERLRLLADLGDHFGHASHVWEGARLPMDEARAVIGRACARPEARNIKIYKLYVRALSFRR